jgi:hypothetical protein
MPSIDFRYCSAIIWQRILRIDPRVLLGSDLSTLLLNRSDTEDLLAQPGFVGCRYKPGGLLFVSMNPGNGGPDGNGADDLLQYTALRELRDSTETDLHQAFERMTAVVGGVMVNWDIFKKLIHPVLGYAGLADLSQVAYLNLFKWRTAKSTSKRQLSQLYTRGWEAHTSDQIECLAPSIIVALGKGPGEHCERHRLTEAPIFTIRRHFDNPRPNNGEGTADLFAIREWFQGVIGRG